MFRYLLYYNQSERKLKSNSLIKQFFERIFKIKTIIKLLEIIKSN